ncbi:MAG TPA: TrkA family potassium uptake protein [Anaerolineaceae bacterium]
MRVVVLGCGRMGSELAYRLFQLGHDVSVVDLSAAALNSLPSDFTGRINEGDALNQDVLHRAGIEEADAVAAVTSSDILNAVIARLAKTEYDVPNIVVRNLEPKFKPMLEAFDVQFVSAALWGAQRIEELLSSSSMRTVFSTGNGEIEVYEFVIPEQWAGRQLGELISEKEVRVISLTRNGKAFLPETTDVLQEGDMLHISATFMGADTVRKLLEAEG